MKVIDLDLDELRFLNEQKLEKESFYFYTTKSRKDAIRKSKEEGKRFFIGSTRCKKGHRLFTSSNHCIVCDTKKIAFTLREVTSGCVYLAYSQQGSIVKIGCSEVVPPLEREKGLQAQSYAGYKDWQIYLYFKSHEVGKSERAISKLFANYKMKDISYIKDNKKQQAEEVFDIAIQIAVDSFKSFALRNNLDTVEMTLTKDSNTILTRSSQEKESLQINILGTLILKSFKFFMRIINIIQSELSNAEIKSNSINQHIDLDGFKLKDMRVKGGALWIDQPVTDLDIVKLKSNGFVYSKKRRAWYKK